MTSFNFSTAGITTGDLYTVFVKRKLPDIKSLGIYLSAK